MMRPCLHTARCLRLRCQIVTRRIVGGANQPDPRPDAQRYPAVPMKEAHTGASPAGRGRARLTVRFCQTLDLAKRIEHRSYVQCGYKRPVGFEVFIKMTRVRRQHHVATPVRTRTP